MASFFITPETVEFSSKGGSATLLITNMPTFGITSTTTGDSNKFLISEFGQEGVATVSARGVNNTSSDYRVSIKYVNNQDPSDYVSVTLVQRAGILSVEPSTIDLDYTSGSSDSVTVNYVGTLSVAADNWLSSRRIAETETGFETWGISATASNPSGYTRTGSVTFTDSNDSSSVAVAVTQAANPSPVLPFEVTPTSLSFVAGGQTKTATLSNIPSGGYSTSKPSWINISASGSSVSLTASLNDTGSQRAGSVEFTDNNDSTNTCSISVSQSYTQMTVSPASLSFTAGGQTKTATLNYIPASGVAITNPSWTTVTRNGTTVSITAGANTTGETRTGTVTITDNNNSGNTCSISVSQSYTQMTVSPASLSFVATGETKTATLSNIPSTGDIIIASPSWATVTRTGTSVSLVAGANTSGETRTGTVTFTASNNSSNTCTITVSQPTRDSFSVSPTSLSFTAGGQTKTATLTNIPSGGYTTSKPSWITLSVSGSTVSLTASANSTGAQRAGTVTFTDNDDNTNSCSISVSQTYSALSVSPTGLSFIPGGETKTATLTNIPSGGVTITSPSWASATREGNTITVVASSNNTGADRTGTVTITDSAHSSNTCTISLTQSKLQMAVTPTVLNFDSGGESKTVTLTNIPSGGYTTTKPNWITLSGTGSVITLTVASYTGSSSRSAEVTFIDTNDSANRCVVTVVQEGEGILPIWRDIEYIPEDVEAGEDYLYRIVGPGDLDYEGLSVAVSLTGGQAYPGPINVARIVESHIHSSSSGLFEYPANQWNVLGQRYTAAFSHIKNGTETFIKDFVFWNDWSGYRTRYSSTQTLNEPINNRGAQNMIIPLCVYNTFDSSFSIVNDSSTESLGIPPYQFSIYTGSYTGEKVEFKKGADTLFSYDLTYCGQGYFIYRNRYGGWDSFLIEGNITREESYKKEQFTTTGLNTLSDSWTKRTDKTNITTTYSATTGWMTDQEAERFVYHLISSPEVYFKDFSQTAHTLTPDRMISSNLTVSKTEYKQFKNGRKMVRYTITWEESKIKQIQR